MYIAVFLKLFLLKADDHFIIIHVFCLDYDLVVSFKKLRFYKQRKRSVWMGEIPVRESGCKCVCVCVCVCVRFK